MIRMKIYIAGPLNSDACGYLKNVHNMIKIANELRKKGHIVFIPCMDLLLGVFDGNLTYKDYFEQNSAWIECCDALFFIESSPGADKELDIARELGINIFYSLDEVEDVSGFKLEGR